MLEASRAKPKTSGVWINAVSGQKVLRLKAWREPWPEATRAMLTGRELPLQVGAVLPGPIRVLCIGPGDWLIVSEKSQPSDVSQHGFALIDLTDGLAALELSGPAARDVLSKGCGLDVHPRSLPMGRCATTRFAQLYVVIECRDEPSSFVLYVSRSYLPFLHSWLVDAAAEFGDGIRRL